MNARLWVGALALACIAPGVHAETLYVIEQLVVSVNATPDGSGERVGQIHSGDSVELLERQEDQAHVRLDSGQDGWVKSSYLSSALPLQQQLDARSADLERVRKEKNQLEADLTAARAAVTAANAAASKRAGTPTPPAPPSEPAPAAAQSVSAPPPSQAERTQSAEPDSASGPALFAADPVMPTRPTWLWALASSIVALVIGFALGWRMLDRRIRAKYGGLRIY